MKRSEKLLLSVFAILFLAIVGGGLLTIGVQNYQGMQAENDRLKDRLSGMAATIAQSADWQRKSDWVDQPMPKFASHEDGVLAFVPDRSDGGGEGRRQDRHA
ncbi:MAG: hypothetical protein ACOYOF_16300 [Verrucomicrobiaceae bacterium]